MMNEARRARSVPWLPLLALLASHAGRAATPGEPSAPQPLAGPCVTSDTVLCISDQPGDNRFRVEVTWSTTQGGGLSGTAHAVSTAPIGFSQGGIFWFFSSANPEMLVKILNGYSTNQKYWVFISAGTNVGMTTTVTDTVTGNTKSYVNPDLSFAVPIQDTAALPASAPTLPVIVSFTANPDRISKGGSSTLSWASTSGSTASLDNGIGPVTLNGSIVVTPTQAATVYKLTVTNAAGSVSATAGVSWVMVSKL